MRPISACTKGFFCCPEDDDCASGRRLPRRALLERLAMLAATVGASGRLRLHAAPGASEAAGLWNVSGSAPHLVVHYMPWFGVTRSAADAEREWMHWKSNDKKALHDPERYLPDGRRDIASVYYPLIGPYSTWNPNVLRYHMETIRAMGAVAVIVDW